MKFLLLLSLCTGSLAMANTSAIPHLDLEMTSEEYARILQNNNLKSIQTEPQITTAINLGERISKWIQKINARRAPTNAIRLTSPTTRVGIPIDKPNVYNPTIIGQKTTDALRDMPAEMKSILTSNVELPADISVDDETFIKFARPLDKTYQMAARYRSLDPHRSHYTMNALKDVRGYHYLTVNKIGAHELRDVNLIPANKRALVKDAMVKICANANGGATCASRVNRAYQENKLAELYNLTYPHAKNNWTSFFVIPTFGVRKDVQWSDTRMVVPFNTPSIAKFSPYLKNNIEEEFRFGPWSLKLSFGSFGNGPRLIFKPGQVPHVDRLGGNEIVMDSNQPIEEYESQWTIRHEFGHVVGLPDCYHEFYDTSLRAYVNYQLDTTDLMCSRAGNMNERIYQQLKKVYSK